MVTDQALRRARCGEPYRRRNIIPNAATIPRISPLIIIVFVIVILRRTGVVCFIVFAVRIFREPFIH